jgi:hypothetical protein
MIEMGLLGFRAVEVGFPKQKLPSDRRSNVMSEHPLETFRLGLFHPMPDDRLLLLEAQKSITEARKALDLPQPTTFLGERHYEPFPLPEREE